MYHRWEMSYNGNLFEDEITLDTDRGPFSIAYFDKWEDANEWYNFYSQYEELDVHLTDNEYNVTLYKGEWY